MFWGMIKMSLLKKIKGNFLSKTVFCNWSSSFWQYLAAYHVCYAKPKKNQIIVLKSYSCLYSNVKQRLSTKPRNNKSWILARGILWQYEAGSKQGTRTETHIYIIILVYVDKINIRVYCSCIMIRRGIYGEI